MKALARLGLPGLVLAIALTLAACGSNAGSSGGDRGDGMQGMDHGGSGGKTSQKEETTGDMAAMSRQMVMPGGEYSDAAFIDAMVPHHEGAVKMAEVGVKNAEHEEIRRLSRNIVDSQRAEIVKLKDIRKGLDGPVGEMSEEDISMMGMTEDPQQLANEDPFDRAFIDNMIPHHQSAIAMAQVALEESNNPEIIGIAEDIVSAQEREIEQMKRWRQEWYPEG